MALSSEELRAIYDTTYLAAKDGADYSSVALDAALRAVANAARADVIKSHRALSRTNNFPSHREFLDFLGETPEPAIAMLAGRN